MTASPETFTATRNPTYDERAVRTRELFLSAQSCTSADERRQLLDIVIEMHLDYAHAQATKYRSRGVPLDDLRQVAALALTKAANGYDVSTGHDFLSYAGPTIRGELRKYFRDHGWMIRPTRSIQELQARISTAEAELAFELGASPRPAQIAEHLNVPIEPVLEALASDGCFTPASLDLTVRNDRAATLGDLLPGDDVDHRAAEARMMLYPAIEHPQRARPNHPQAALLRGTHPARGRGSDRRHPDAGVPTPHPHPGPAPAARRRYPRLSGSAAQSTTMTCRFRGPCTPSTRLSSMSLVADGPLIQVCGRSGWS